MKILCGTDIIEIDRIENSINNLGSSLLNRIFTEYEQYYCESRIKGKYQSYAARYAAKEAVVKAFGTGISNGINFTDIEITNLESGKPVVTLYNSALTYFKTLNCISIDISLSHCKNTAVAYAVMLVK